MILPLEGRRILIIDRQPYWRDKASGALEAQGARVHVLGSYDYVPETAYFNGEPPDLVILGCSSIKHEERALMSEVLADKRHLVVLCASLPWADMRALFLAGADDVMDKPYDSNRLVGIVANAFTSIAIRDGSQADEG
jgi:DNA-binding response OmpR family regulator